MYATVRHYQGNTELADQLAARQHRVSLRAEVVPATLRCAGQTLRSAGRHSGAQGATQERRAPVRRAYVPEALVCVASLTSRS